MSEYCLAAFSSTFAAITAQKLLREGGVPFQVMPVPREISASCGIALRFASSRLGDAARCMSSLSRELYAFYRAGERLEAVEP